MQFDTNTIFQQADWIFTADTSLDVVNTCFDYQAQFRVDCAEKLKLHLCASTPDVLSRKNTHYKDGDMELVNDVLGFVFKYDACAEELPFAKSVLAAKAKCLFPRPIKKCVVEGTTSGTLKNQGIFLADHSNVTTAKAMLQDYLSSRLFVCMGELKVPSEEE